MMQFNPLFLNDIKGTQASNGKQNAGKKNKYLFSDIINIVMEESDTKGKLKKLTLDEQSKASEILGGNIIRVAEQLQNKIITDSENEKMKIQLADILPEEMSKLITGDDSEINDEQLISYVGKDRMHGELKNFLTDLVGQKIFDEYVTNNSGVLVKLEDSKSAVSIEVTKEVTNASDNKTMVQAIVVPRKSKLQSLTKNNFLNGLKNVGEINNTFPPEVKPGKDVVAKNISKETMFNNQNVKPEVTFRNQDVKPTLSVYSFDVETEMLSNENKIISPKELRVNRNDYNNAVTKETVNIEKEIKSNGKIVENKITEDNNLNISKITIVKKQNTPVGVEQQKIQKEKNPTTKNITEDKITSKIFEEKIDVDKTNVETATNKVEKPKEKIIPEIKSGRKNNDKILNYLNSKDKSNLEVTNKSGENIEINNPKTVYPQKGKNENVSPVKNIKPKDEIIKEEIAEITGEKVKEKSAVAIIPNKKVSVKVKKSVKAVKNQSEHKNIVTENIRPEQKKIQSETNPDLNNSATKNSLSPEQLVHHNKKNEAAFQHVLQKEHQAIHKDSVLSSQPASQQNTERIIQSIEVIKEISRFITKREKGTLSFAIKPEHLGHMKITLETKDNILTAHIQVENDLAKQLVEKNINQLHSQLKESGVELSSLNVSLGNSSNEQKSLKSGNNNTANATNLNENEMEEQSVSEKKQNKSLGYNTYEYLA